MQTVDINIIFVVDVCFFVCCISLAVKHKNKSCVSYTRRVRRGLCMCVCWENVKNITSKLSNPMTIDDFSKRNKKKTKENGMSRMACKYSKWGEKWKTTLLLLLRRPMNSDRMLDKNAHKSPFTNKKIFKFLLSHSTTVWYSGENSDATNRYAGSVTCERRNIKIGH